MTKKEFDMSCILYFGAIPFIPLRKHVYYTMKIGEGGIIISSFNGSGIHFEIDNSDLMERFMKYDEFFINIIPKIGWS